MRYLLKLAEQSLSKGGLYFASSAMFVTVILTGRQTAAAALDFVSRILMRDAMRPQRYAAVVEY